MAPSPIPYLIRTGPNVAAEIDPYSATAVLSSSPSTDKRGSTEAAVALHTLDRMLEFERPISRLHRLERDGTITPPFLVRATRPHTSLLLILGHDAS